MSTPDSAGESLESILASIRKSLSEQSTDVLAPELVPDGEEAVPPLPQILAKQPPDAAPAAPQQRPAAPNGSAASSPAEEPPPPVAAAPVVAPAPAAAAPEKDPLWFLSHEAAEKGAGQPAGSDAPAPMDAQAGKPPVEPRPSRAGVMRGPLPPFFGSNAEVAKVETPVAPTVLGGPLPTVIPATAGRAPDGGVRENGRAWPGAADGAPNGRASSIFSPAPADARNGASDSSAQMQALEVMVAELLRPMLRRWLDENMPRLVSAALKAEAAERASKKP